jgi:lipopolysaccharide transport system permease protein
MLDSQAVQQRSSPSPAPAQAPQPSTRPPERPVLRIRPPRRWRAVDLGALWRYRELLWFLALRDVQVRYKQTAFGAAWAVIQPLFTMLVFTLFFGHLGGMSDRIPEGVPYSVYVLCALVPWQLFAFALNQSSTSLVSNRNLITKVYFPRLLVPMAPLLCGLVDFSVSFGLLLGVMVYFGVVPGAQVLALPLFLLLALMTSLAVGLWLSALNAVYRDVQFTLPFLTQLWLFVTPVAYPSTIVPERWRWLFGLNPMAGVVDGFRWALLGAEGLSWPVQIASLASVTLLLVGGLYYFRSMESTFADLV